MNKISHDLMESRDALARRAKDIRQHKKLTLQQVADKSGLAVSTISKIERALISPTYDRFSMLAAGLDVDMSELFADAGNRFATGELAISRDGDEGYLETENYTYEMLFPHVRGKAMVPMMGTLKPLEKMRFDRMVSHTGQEFLFVLEGAVIVQLEGSESVTLKTGESIYFDSRRGHLYASATEQAARILVVCTQSPESPAPEKD